MLKSNQTGLLVRTGDAVCFESSTTQALVTRGYDHRMAAAQRRRPAQQTPPPPSLLHCTASTQYGIHHHLALLMSSAAAGVAVTSVLNPCDRALFLSVASVGRSFIGATGSILGKVSVRRRRPRHLVRPLVNGASSEEACGHEVTASLPSGAQAALAGQLAGGANAAAFATGNRQVPDMGLARGQALPAHGPKVYARRRVRLLRGCLRPCGATAPLALSLAGRCRLRECGADVQEQRGGSSPTPSPRAPRPCRRHSTMRATCSLRSRWASRRPARRTRSAGCGARPCARRQAARAVVRRLNVGGRSAWPSA